MRKLIGNRWFALMDLFLVILSGIAWMVIPAFGLWFTLLALVPWGLRSLGKFSPFQRTPLNWVFVIFLVTAWIGYWASYDKDTAWVKVWLVMTALLLYFALSGQPKKNLAVLSLFCFVLGICASIYFFLTDDLAVDPGSLGIWWLSIRPEVPWPAISHGYTSGVIAITSIFAVYMVRDTANRSSDTYSIVKKLFVILGTTIMFGAFILTWSGGILVAGLAALGVWILWKILISGSFVARPWLRSLFPSLVLVCLAAMIIMVYLVPASIGGSPESTYGKNTRAELFARGSHFVVDYPITGAGLNSFPGLYSQYMIVIPFFYFINTYNLFLDVAIEQGLMGGLAVIFLYFASIWLVSQTIIKTSSEQIRFFNWLSLFALLITVVHGLFYDYLYNDKGTVLLFFPVGISMIGVLDVNSFKDRQTPLQGAMLVRHRINIRIVLVLVASLITILALNGNKLISIWYANLGAVKMSQIELHNFPTNRWVGAEIASDLTEAEALLLSALNYDPDNQTANHRLGLISMVRQDFDIASVYLEKAHKEAPDHRGIIKTLGYCYVWLGQTEKARLLLAQIPESKNELKTYIWWWETHQRADLAEKASFMVSKLESLSSQ